MAGVKQPTKKGVQVPYFGITSPFYLKAGIAVLHILSIYLTMMPPPPHAMPSSENQQQTTTTGAAEHSKSSLYADTGKVMESMQNTVLDTVLFFPSIFFHAVGIENPTPSSSAPFPSSSSPTPPDAEQQPQEPIVQQKEESSSTSAWTDWWRKHTYMHAIMHLITGQHGFIHLPVSSCILCLLAAAVPSMASFTKYREDVVAVVLPTMLYMTVCAHVCALAMVAKLHVPTCVWGGFLCLSASITSAPLVTGSAFLLHACTHAMHHCIQTYMDMASRVRQVASGSILFLPIAYMGMATVYVLALATPVVLYKLPTPTTFTSSRGKGGNHLKEYDHDHNSVLKDMIVVHALMAFLPECMGLAFGSVLKVLQKLLDNPNYDNYL